MQLGSEAQQYLERARQCVEIATIMGDAKQKLVLLDMAQAWTLLAKQADKNKSVREEP